MPAVAPPPLDAEHIHAVLDRIVVAPEGLTAPGLAAKTGLVDVVRDARAYLDGAPVPVPEAPPPPLVIVPATAAQMNARASYPLYFAARAIHGRSLTIAAGQPFPAAFQSKAALRRLAPALGIGNADSVPFADFNFVRQLNVGTLQVALAFIEAGISYDDARAQLDGEDAAAGTRWRRNPPLQKKGKK